MKITITKIYVHFSEGHSGYLCYAVVTQTSNNDQLVRRDLCVLTKAGCFRGLGYPETHTLVGSLEDIIRHLRKYYGRKRFRICEF